MKIYSIDDIRLRLDKRAVIDTVRDALVRHSRGEVQSPMPGHLLLKRANGDCHIKYGHMAGSPNFAVKVATGFYDNSKLGLPVNNGLIIVFDAQTGAPVSLFQDEGWLTAWRTAAATALAADILAPRKDVKVGVMGTGLQGQLAVAWIAELMPEARFTLYGRDASRTKQVAAELGIATSLSAEDMLKSCDIIITATPSTHALFRANLARPGMHFVSVGADSPEKQELPEALFAAAAIIATDDHRQCMTLGDFGRAVRAGHITEMADQSLGDLLSHDAVLRSRDAITIVDLTGIAAQDIAIASLFEERLAK